MEELRFMTADRLETVHQGMTEEEVQGLLGLPTAANVREFDEGVVGWFYPKEVPGTAAAVFFREEGDRLRVYSTKIDAVKADEN